MRIPLTKDLAQVAIDVACARNAENRASGQKDGLLDTTNVAGEARTSLRVDVEGALGEAVVATALDLAWDGAFKSAEEWKRWRTEGWDVAGLEVRATTYLTGKLLVQPRNSDMSPYVLVILDFPGSQAIIPGWCWGYEAKHQDYWMHAWVRPCFAVPQHALRSIFELLTYRQPDGLFRK